VKDPALAVVPALALAGRAPWAWATAALLLALGEGWLWVLYGRPHPWEVLAHASEIARGPLDGRVLGLLVRLPFGLSPLLLLGPGLRSAWGPGFVAGGAALLWAWPDGLESGQHLALLALAVAGGAALALVARADRMLGAWAVAVALAVALGHNYAAPRYLLPAVLPLALVAARHLPSGALWVGLAAQLALALPLVAAERALAVAGDQVAAAVVRAFPAGGSFTGEWSFRHRLEAEGWTAGGAGGVLAAARNASPGPLPADFVEEGRFASGPGFPLRLVDLEAGVGFYAETLGALPVGWGRGPLEEGRVGR
jgi:hypothetical protein